MHKIMIIEDDPSTREELTLLLENEGHQVLAVTDFTDVAGQLRDFGPHLALLDLGLPGKDGFTLCMEIRRGSDVPVIFLTSRDSAMDELQALNLGGDDYITKPYHIPVLLARINTVLRRARQEPDRLEAKGLTVSLSRGTASAGGAAVELTRNELRILAHLMQRPGEIVSRADLIDALWDDHIYIDDNTLSVNMTRLRGKLEGLKLPDYIRTRRGAGVSGVNGMKISRGGTDMTLGEFLWDRLGRLVLLLAAGAGSILFLSLTGTQPGILAILGLVWAILFLAMQAVDFLKCRGRLLELEAILEGLDQKHLFAECLPRPETVRERALFGLMRRAGKGAVEAVSDARAAQREYREYIESWVHEIKTPITAARLICRGADSVLRRKLITELSQIENHVERALFYARAESPEQDFLIRQSSLEAIAAEAIEQHRSLLIQSGVRIETQGLEQTVYTDGKWACFLLGQLLQNAVRYRNPEPVIVLAAKPLGRQVQLTVSDNGLGIPAQELPRIFDRGFTGSNGRARGGSTGMGLYLCRKLAAMLEIRLEARSLEGQGTAVILTFPARETLP